MKHIGRIQTVLGRKFGDNHDMHIFNYHSFPGLLASSLCRIHLSPVRTKPRASMRVKHLSDLIRKDQAKIKEERFTYNKNLDGDLAYKQWEVLTAGFF